MGNGMEKGTLLEQRAQLEIQLTQEQFFCEHIPQKRQMAVIGIVLNILFIILLAKVVIWIAKGIFGIVVAPILFVFWIIWIRISFKEWGKDFHFLFRSNCDMEIAASMARQERLKRQIAELNREIDAIPVQVWQG